MSKSLRNGKLNAKTTESLSKEEKVQLFTGSRFGQTGLPFHVASPNVV